MPSNKAYALNQSPFYKLKTKQKLIKILDIDMDELNTLCATADDSYKEFDIEKKGKIRRVENPSFFLKKVQKRISRYLSRIQPPDYLFCPVKGRCYISNAAKHRGNRVVKCLDIRKYFPSTPSWRVYIFFRYTMKCEEDVAAILARLSCYKGHLPTGSPLSPIMSYFAFYNTWEGIANICNEEGYTLTVYIDDVTISGKRVDAAKIWEIKKLIHRSGLEYHKEKSFIDRPAEITGVFVNGQKISAPNRQYKKRRVLASKKSKVLNRLSEKEQLQLSGVIGQIEQIRNLSGKL